LCRKVFGGGLARALQVFEFAASLVSLAAEADGAAAETDFAVQREIGGGSLGERIEGLEAETDDGGGEMQLFDGRGVVIGERCAGRVAGGVEVVSGGGEVVKGEVGQNGIEGGGR